MPLSLGLVDSGERNNFICISRGECGLDFCQDKEDTRIYSEQMGKEQWRWRSKIQRAESPRWKLATDGIKFPQDRKDSDYKHS